jgi:TetR/AcrR family transcriptional regulator, regulator of mycofactocin system
MRSIDGMTEMEDQSLAAQLRAKRSELMVAELEAVALRLFDERGFHRITVDEIASEAHISVRTFYRYFPANVLQVNIDRRSPATRSHASWDPS